MFAFQAAHERRKFAAAPWIWPPDAHGLDDVCLQTGMSAPPLLRPGQAPLLAVNDTCSSLWLLDLAQNEPSDDFELLPVRGQALRAWQTACDALNASIPVLWQSLSELRRRHLHAECLTSRAFPGHQAAVRHELDGTSFGLAFVAAQAGWVLQLPLPNDVAFSATVDGRGVLSSVRGLRDKIGLLAQAPRIRRLFVCETQAEDVAEFASNDLEIIAVHSASAVLGHLWPDLDAHLVKLGSDPQKRRELIEQLSALALGTRGALRDWSPIERTALLANGQWQDLAPEDHNKLQFAAAIAARHERNLGALSVPSTAELQKLMEPMRSVVVAQVVQQAADSGFPDSEAAKEFGLANCVRGNAAFEPHLKILGALARLCNVAGPDVEALDFAREATLGWLARNNPEAACYPICAWLRAAVFAEGAGAWDEVMEHSLTIANKVAPESAAYLRLALGQSYGLRGDMTAAIRQLAPLLPEGSAPAHDVRHSAARWLLRLEPDSHAYFAQAEATLADDCVGEAANEPNSRSWSAAKFLALAQLDAALSAFDAARVEEAVAQFLTLEPQPGAMVYARSVGLGPIERGRFLADRYPY